MKTLGKTSLQQNEREAIETAVDTLKREFPVDKLVLFCGMSQQEIIDFWIEKAEIGKRERFTQNRVVRLFQDILEYGYLGNLTDREDWVDEICAVESR